MEEQAKSLEKYAINLNLSNQEELDGIKALKRDVMSRGNLFKENISGRLKLVRSGYEAASSLLKLLEESETSEHGDKMVRLETHMGKIKRKLHNKDTFLQSMSKRGVRIIKDETSWGGCKELEARADDSRPLYLLYLSKSFFDDDNDEEEGELKWKTEQLFRRIMNTGGEKRGSFAVVDMALTTRPRPQDKTKITGGEGKPALIEKQINGTVVLSDVLLSFEKDLTLDLVEHRSAIPCNKPGKLAKLSIPCPHTLNKG